MRVLTLLDTTTSTDNLGDEIIMNAVRSELRTIIPDAYFYTVATHDSMGRRARKLLRKSEFSIVGGTNILSSNLLRASGWKVWPTDLPSMKDVVLMGVGWRDYQNAPTWYSKLMYDRILSKSRIHSSRDKYTRDRVIGLGLRSCNTTCPTLWQFTPARCAAISTVRSKEVVTTLTYYRADPENDRKTLDLLRKNYDRIHFWSQQCEDLAYLRSLGSYDVQIIDPNLGAYSDFLRDNDVDYVGSRLHGGIHALHHDRRALIVVVDNRAAEIGKDTNLPIVKRSDIAAIEQWIAFPAPTEVRLPVEAIDTWKAQFAL